MTKYECGLTGEKDDGAFVDGVEVMPPGWFEIRVTRKIVNPAWQAIAYTKDRQLQATLATIPEADRAAQAALVALLIEAQFAALEAKTKVLIDDYTSTVHVCESEDALEALSEILESLGADPLVMEDEESDTDDDGEPES